MEKYCPNCMKKLNDEAVCGACGCSTDIVNEVSQLSVGTVLNNRYYIGRSIGAGGFGITYVALDTLLETKVAVKEFFPSQAATRVNSISSEVTIIPNSSGENQRIFETGQKNFLLEARTVAKFKNSGGIVNVQDIFNANNTSYIVMDFLEGETLGGYLKSHGEKASYELDGRKTEGFRIPFEETMSILRPVLAALIEVHKAGIIHRDISPDNIMVYKGVGTLFDFGAARSQTSDSEKSLTVILKYGYAPLEQHRRTGKQGPWTDIYALCATIYRCITGIAPVDVLDRLEAETLASPSSLGIAIPEEAEKALLKGLSVNFQKRQQSIEELQEDFSAVAVKENIAPATVQKPTPVANVTPAKPAAPVVPVASVAPVASVVSPNTANTAKSEKKKKILPIVIAAVALVVVIIIISAIFGGDDNSSDTSNGLGGNLYSPDSSDSSGDDENKENDNDKLEVKLVINTDRDDRKTDLDTFNSEDTIYIHYVCENYNGENDVKLGHLLVVEGDGTETEVDVSKFTLPNKLAVAEGSGLAKGECTFSLYSKAGDLLAERTITIE